MKKLFGLFFVFALGIAFVAGGFQPAVAQEGEEDEFTLEELVVTAQKREQLVQDVPIAMTVTSKEQLERQMVYSLQDLSRTTPGLEFGDGGPGGGAVIRGIGTSNLGGAQLEPSVGVVVDGVPMGSINVGNMFDMERVEVLRGPQGTLFGNSASAGIINITTASPELGIFKGKVGIDYTGDDVLGSDFGRQEFRAMLNIPVTTNSAIRLTGNANLSQGIKKNKYPGMDDHESTNLDIRAKYLYQPSENFAINLIVDYADRDEDGPNLFTMTYLRPTAEPDNNDIDFPFLTEYFASTCGMTASEDNQDVCTDFKMYDESKRYGLSAQIDWTMANHDFVSITSFKENTSGPYNQNIFGYGHPKLNTIPEFVAVPLPFPPFTIYPGQQYFLDIRREIESENVSEIFSQELRVSAPLGQKFDYVAGFFYTTTETSTEGGFGTTQSWYPAPEGFVTQGEIETNYSRGSYESSNMAIFADGNYPITDTFTILGGIRLSNYTIKSYSKTLEPGNPAFGLKLQNGPELDESYFTWRVGGQYDINPDAMLYATVSRGVKAPVSVREDPTDPTSDYKTIAAEMPTSYEVGTKIAAFDNKVALDFNIFYNDITDYQGESCSYNELQDSLQCSPKTIDGLVSKGFEVDIFGQPIRGLAINFGYIYNVAEYEAGFADELTGEQIQNAPLHKLTFSGDYSRHVTESLLGFLAMDVTYKSEKRLNSMWYDSSIYPSNWVFGAQIGLRESNDKWNLALFARNIFQESEPTAIYQAYHNQMHMSVTNENSYRQVGLSFNMNF